MESTTFYRIQIDQPNVFLFISENGSYKSGSKRVTVQLRTAVPAASKTSKKEKVAEVDNKEAPNAESLLSIRKEVDFLEERLKKIRRYTIKPNARQ